MVVCEATLSCDNEFVVALLGICSRRIGNVLPLVRLELILTDLTTFH